MRNETVSTALIQARYMSWHPCPPSCRPYSQLVCTAISANFVPKLLFFTLVSFLHS